MKLFLYASLLIFSFNLANGMTIKNQAKKPITVIADYSNDNFYRVYELKPTFLNKQPKLKINHTNLNEIQIYYKIPTHYNTEKKITINQIHSFKDVHQNKYKKITKKTYSKLPNPILEIEKDNLTNKEYAIMPSPQKGLTFVEIEKNINMQICPGRRQNNCFTKNKNTLLHDHNNGYKDNVWRCTRFNKSKISFKIH